MTMEQALMIQAKALQVDGLQSKTSRLTGDYPTVFIYTYGHIGTIEINVHESGWRTDENPDREFVFHLDDALNQEQYTDYISYMDGLLQKNSPVPDQSNGAEENKSLL